MALTVSKTSTGREYKVKDISQADFGRHEIELAQVEMPGLISCRTVRSNSALQRSPHHRLSPHDHPNRRPYRDPHFPRRRSPLVFMQHLLNSRTRRLRRRVRMEGRDSGRILVVHREGT